MRVMRFCVTTLLIPCLVAMAGADTLVVCSAAKDKSLVVFRLNPLTGELTRLGSQLLTGEPGGLALSPDRRTLFVALRSTGELTSLRVEGNTGKLTPLRVVDGGADPAQISLDRAGKFLLTAYYVAGKVSVHRVEPTGSLSWLPTQELITAEKAHAVSLDRADELLVVPHTGPSRIFQFRFDRERGLLGALRVPSLDLPAGTGPRHAAWHPSRSIVYIDNEQANTVSAYRATQDGLEAIAGSTVSTLPAGFQGVNSTAEIKVHPRGRMLLVSNRGHDSLALVRIDETGEKLTPIGQHKTEAVPRSFTLDPSGQFVLAAGEGNGFLEVSRAMPRGADGSPESLQQMHRVRVGDGLWWVEAFIAPEMRPEVQPGAIMPQPMQAMNHQEEFKPSGWWKLLTTGLPFLGALLCLFGYRRRLRLARLMEDLPTSKAHGVFIGLVQVEGTAEAEEPLLTRMEQQSCVQHAWTVEEEWRRIITETTTDSKGNSVTSTRVESGWNSVDSGGGAIPFYVRDDSGLIRVQPTGATIEAAEIFSVICGTDSDLYFGLGPSSVVPFSTGRRRFIEKAIALHAAVTVVGQARVREDLAAPEIAEDADGPLFLITVKTEAQVLSAYRWGRIGLLLLGSILVSAAIFGWHLLDGKQLGEPGFNGWTFATGLAAFWCLAVVMWIWQVFNSMVELRNRTDRAWSLIDIELKRRADLIPGLVACVQALSVHERGVQEMIARLRAQASASAAGGVAGLSAGLVALREAYPGLMANQANAALMDELKNTEDRIAMAREYFNDQVVWHNIRIQQIPDGLMAWLAGLRLRGPFIASDLDRAEVRVKLHEI